MVDICLLTCQIATLTSRLTPYKARRIVPNQPSPLDAVPVRNADLCTRGITPALCILVIFITLRRETHGILSSECLLHLGDV